MIKNIIRMKHQMHKASDQEFIFKADPIARTLTVHIDELDIVLLNRFLYNTVAGYIGEDIQRIDDYQISVIVNDEYTFRAELRRSEYDSQENTIVLSVY